MSLSLSIEGIHAVEVFRGRALCVVELAVIRLQVESIDTMEQIDDETRALIIRHWPDIADKLPTK